MTRFESLLGKMTIRLLRQPWLCLIVIFAASGLLVYQIENVTFDTSIESFLHKDSEVRQGYINFQSDYGLSEYFIILIHDDDIFSYEGVSRIRDLESEINNHVSYLSGTESIDSTQYISSVGDDIAIDSFFPEDLSSVDYAFKKQKAISTSYYVNRLINPEANTTAIIVKLAFMVKNEKTGDFEAINLPKLELVLKQIKAIVAQKQSNFTEKLVVGGSPTATIELTRATKRDIWVFSVLALLVVSLVLFVVFRRISAVFLPMMSLFLAINITMSMMILGEFPMQVTSSILPSFLLAVCVGDAIHLLQSFYNSYNAGLSKQEAVFYAIRHTCVAMFFTTLTTSVGLLSFSTSAIAPIASFGLFAAFGVWVALLLTLICLPAILLVIPIKAKKNRAVNKARQRFYVTNYVCFIERHKSSIFYSALFLLLVSFVCALQLKFSHDALSWFSDDNEVKQSIQQIDEQLSGTMQVELLLKNRDNVSFSPEQLFEIDQWMVNICANDIAGIKVISCTSLLDLLKETNNVLDPEAGYSLPVTSYSLAQQVLLLQLDDADLISTKINADFSEMRITLATPWRDAVEYTDFLKELRISFSQTFSSQVMLEITGMAAIANNTFTLMLSSMGVSYLIAALVVSMVMIVLLNNLKLGASLMLPNVLPIFFVLAIMFIFNIPLDLFTMIIGSIAIGLIVDDSVHFNYTFLRAKAEGRNTRDSIIESIITTGRALMTTTVILCITFMVYTVSDMKNLQSFGLLTSLCIFFALVADFLLAPAMIFILYSNTEKKSV